MAVTSTRPDTSSGPPADLLGDRYKLGEAIGRGRSTVFRAEDVRLRRPVAVKQVRLFDGGPEDSSGIRRRTMREAHAAARLSDPHVVTVFDVIEEGDSIWLVMELINAPSLSKLVADDGPMVPSRVARVGLDVLSALTAAHAVGVVHRDVKPGNVMVLPNDRAKLGDFGVAKMRDDTQVTAAGLVIGSPAYMAPEQARAERAGPAADLWALGATLYFGVEGLSPFPGNNAIAVATAVIYGLPRPMERAGPLEPLVKQLLAKDPDDRPTADEVRKALRDVVSGTARARRAASSASPSPSDTSIAPQQLPVPPPLPPGAPKHSGGAWRRRLTTERRLDRRGVTPPPPLAAPTPASTATRTPPAGSPPAVAAGAGAPGIAEWLAAANSAEAGDPAPAAEPPADESEDAATVAARGAEAPEGPDASASPAGPDPRASLEPGAADGGAGDPPTIVIEDDGRPALGAAVPPAGGGAATAPGRRARADEHPGMIVVDDGRPGERARSALAGRPLAPAPAPPAARAPGPGSGPDSGSGERPSIVIEDDDRPALGVASPPAASIPPSPGVAGAAAALGAAVGARPSGEPTVAAAATPSPHDDSALASVGPGADAPRAGRAAASSSGGPPPLIRTIDGSSAAWFRRPPVLALAVVALLLVSALAVRAATGGEKGEQGAGDGSPSTTAPATTAAPGTTGEPTATATTAPATTTTAGGVPAGWATYTDPSGAYTIAHPPGWTVEPAGGPRTKFREPGTGTYLMVDWTPTPGADPVADWQSQSTNFAARHQNYRTVRIDRAPYRDYDAAVWEFGYSDGGADLHVANLGFVAGSRGYALYFQTHEENWAAGQATFRQFQQAFSPAGGA